MTTTYKDLDGRRVRRCPACGWLHNGPDRLCADCRAEALTVRVDTVITRRRSDREPLVYFRFTGDGPLEWEWTPHRTEAAGFTNRVQAELALARLYPDEAAEAAGVSTAPARGGRAP